MALRTQTIEYAFPARTTALASATRNDFAAVTLYIPETSSRTFRSAYVRVYARFNSTIAASTTATLVGVKLGAAAFSDSTVTTTYTATGDQYSFITTRDFTSYFNTNFGAGGSQTCQVGVQFTGPLTISICAKLILTYEYDDSSATTRIKTVRIPLESPTAQLTATIASIGTNQIPALDTFLPEASKTYREVWFEISANDGGNATTDFNMAVELDTEGETARSVLEQALSTAVYYEDIWVRDDMTTNAVHDFRARSTLASRFSLLTVVLYVTYEYDHSSSTRIINSLVLPFADELGWAGNTTTNDKSRYDRVLFVQEPGTITLVQSGAIVSITDPGTVTLHLLAGSQSDRTYGLTAGSSQSGPYTVGHRIDSGSASGAFGTLSRGRNTITLDRFTTAASSGSNFSAMLILNYTSDKHTDGVGAHSHSTAWTISPSAAMTTQENMAAPTALFNIPESSYFVAGLLFTMEGTSTGTATWGFALQAEHLSGEPPGAGWEELVSGLQRSDSEMGVFLTAGAARDQFIRWPNDPETNRLVLETTRQYRACYGINCSSGTLAWLTYHSITCTVSGSISGSAAGTVNLYLHRTIDNCVVLSGSRSGDGAYSFTWYNDVDDVYVSAYEDTTHKGLSKKAAPTTGFDISLSAAAGGGECYF